MLLPRCVLICQQQNSCCICDGTDLKGKYLGHTSHTVKEAIADAMGGCLFLDEAYALVDGGGDGFSSEAVRTLLTEVENNRTNLLVVLAGYEDKMLTNDDSLMKMVRINTFP